MYHWTWLFLIPGVQNGSAIPGISEAAEPAAWIVPASWLVFAIITAVAVMANRGLAAARARGGTAQYIPAENLGARNLMEILTEGLLNLSDSILGSRKAAITYLPLIGGIFAYILVGNLMGLVPGFIAPTSDLNTNIGMALIVFVVFNVAGVMVNGMDYFKHLAGPVWYLFWLILPIEIIGLVARPVSLTVRLFGNMNGDHMVFGVFSDLIPIIIPSVFLGLGLFICFVQAFVFALLSVVYISLSVAHDDDH